MHKIRLEGDHQTLTFGVVQLVDVMQPWGAKVKPYFDSLKPLGLSGLCCMCDVVWCGGGGGGLVKVCIFHNQKMHVYLINSKRWFLISMSHTVLLARTLCYVIFEGYSVEWENMNKCLFLHYWMRNISYFIGFFRFLTPLRLKCHFFNTSHSWF